MMFYSITFVLLIVCAVFYYRAAEYEGSSGVLWCSLSVLVSVLTWRVLHLGLLGTLLGQVALFLGITLVRTLRKS
jgi:hypothetical protein